MHVAAAAGHISMAEALQGMEMSPTAAASSSKLQPLHLAAAGGHVAMLGWLLLARGQVDARARGDLCPIHLASLDGHLQAGAAILGQEQQVNAGLESRCTPCIRLWRPCCHFALHRMPWTLGHRHALPVLAI